MNDHQLTDQQLEPLDFAPEELFFSTTDARGVIQKANGVFVRLSGHPWTDLVGAPHNLVRHDDMPGGAFRLMWDTLRAGEPFCAYVMNRSRSGRPYTVFATITPLGEGYLSVRSRPSVPELRDAAFTAYHRARALERERRSQGLGAPAVAVEGAELLGEDLAALGFESYESFTLAALPAEVEARRRQAHGLPQRPGEGPLHELLACIGRIDARLDLWLDEMASLAALAQELVGGTAELAEDMAAARRTADEVSATKAGPTAPVMLAVSVWASMMPEIDEQLTTLRGELAELARSCARTRFRIALARLHNDASGQFAAELIDQAAAGAPPESGSGLDAISDLVRALAEGLATAIELAQSNARLAAGVATAIETVQELMLVPQGLLGNWQEMAQGSQEPAVAALIPRMAAQVEQGDRTTRRLAGLANSCRERAVPLDAQGISGELAQIRALVTALAPSPDETTPARGHQAPAADTAVPSRPRRGA